MVSSRNDVKVYLEHLSLISPRISPVILLGSNLIFFHRIYTNISIDTLETISEIHFWISYEEILAPNVGRKVYIKSLKSCWNKSLKSAKYSEEEPNTVVEKFLQESRGKFRGEFLCDSLEECMEKIKTILGKILRSP